MATQWQEADLRVASGKPVRDPVERGVPTLQWSGKRLGQVFCRNQRAFHDESISQSQFYFRQQFRFFRPLSTGRGRLFQQQGTGLGTEDVGELRAEHMRHAAPGMERTRRRRKTCQLRPRRQRHGITYFRISGWALQKSPSPWPRRPCDDFKRSRLFPALARTWGSDPDRVETRERGGSSLAVVSSALQFRRRSCSLSGATLE